LFAGSPADAGGRFEERAREFLGVASGSGVEVPEWLERLGGLVDAEIGRAELGSRAGRAAMPPVSLPDAVPWRPLPWPELRQALGG